MSSDAGCHERLVDDVLAERLARYLTLLRRWNKAINLVAPSTLNAAWVRHVEDSSALLAHAPSRGRWIDIGSGGGFPGMVLAIVGTPLMSMTLVESDQRKCEFLRTVARDLRLDVNIENRRLDFRDPLPADVVTARAVAPLKDLLGCIVTSTGDSAPVGLFPKGVKWKQEADEARFSWRFDMDVLPSRTEPGAAILRVFNVIPR